MSANFESNFFTLLELLDPVSRLEVEGVCTKVSIPPNEIIYKQGDPSNAVYIIVSGCVEAFTHSPDGQQTRSVGFMGRGEFFGDLGILTNHDRLAGIRTCEPTKLLQIEKLAFVRILEKIPKMGAYFSRNLARRLHHTSTQAHLDIYSIHLAGNLQYFDLFTIFQAITGMRRSGELQLNNANNEMIGSYFFREGRMEHARFVHLTGIEAVLHGFVKLPTNGTFALIARDTVPAQFTDETRLDCDSTDLLMQGATCKDYFFALPEVLREMKGRIGRIAENLTWNEEATQAVASRIWELIAKRPQPLDSMWRRLNVSVLTYLQTINAMVESGQVEVLVEEPPHATEAPAPADPSPAKKAFAFEAKPAEEKPPGDEGETPPSP